MPKSYITTGTIKLKTKGRIDIMNGKQIQSPAVPGNALLINSGWSGLFGEDQYPLVQ